MQQLPQEVLASHDWLEELLLAGQPAKVNGEVDYQDTPGSSSKFVELFPGEHELFHELGTSEPKLWANSHGCELSTNNLDAAGDGLTTGNAFSSEFVAEGDPIFPKVSSCNPDLLAPTVANEDMAAIVKFLEDYVEKDNELLIFPENPLSMAATGP